MTAAPLVIEDLHVDFGTDTGSVSAVDGVSLSVERGEIVGLVGESGCGKSTLANAAMGLLPPRAQVRGSVRLDGQELLGRSENELRRLRGSRIAMIFQDPSTSLDPTCSVGKQIADTIRAHQDVTRRRARIRAVELMGEVGIPDPNGRFDDPPHRLSGGMRQRIVVAAALANDPSVLIADEPTTALDVTIQAQILDLIIRLSRDHGTATLLISHDLGVIAQVAHRVGVMYAGQYVERADVGRLFAHPEHPYTRALLAALPTAANQPGALAVIPGQVPDLADPPAGCRFAERCAVRRPECDTTPPTVRVGTTDVDCWDVAARTGTPAAASTDTDTKQVRS